MTFLLGEEDGVKEWQEKELVTPGKTQAEVHCILGGPSDPSSLTFGEDTLTKTMMGASEVLASCAGWLMVSASNTTSCRDLASSNMRSISLCTSAEEGSSSPGALATAIYQGFESCYTAANGTDQQAWAGGGLGKGGGQHLGQVVGRGQDHKEFKVFTSIKRAESQGQRTPHQCWSGQKSAR